MAAIGAGAPRASVYARRVRAWGLLVLLSWLTSCARDAPPCAQPGGSARRDRGNPDRVASTDLRGPRPWTSGVLTAVRHDDGEKTTAEIVAGCVGSFPYVQEGSALRSSEATFYAMDLRGSDCDRATDTVHVVHGDHVILRPIERHRCAPGFAREGAACTYRVTPAVLPGMAGASPCEVPIAGQRSEVAAAAWHLFDEGRFAEALPLLLKVAAGDTGDDDGNRQLASYAYAMCLVRLDRVPEANFVLERVATHPCHLRQREARELWIEPAARRRLSR